MRDVALPAPPWTRLDHLPLDPTREDEVNGPTVALRRTCKG